MKRVVVTLLAAVLVAGGCAGLYVAFTPGSSIKALLDRLAPDGSADEFPPERVGKMKVGAGAAGAALIGAGAWLLRRRRRVESLLEDAGSAGTMWAGHLVAAARSVPWWEWAALGVVTSAGAAVRLAFIQQPMRSDEATTFLEFSSPPLWLTVTYYPVPNNHIFHSVLVFFSIRLFGIEPWAVRLPAFTAGVAMIPLAYAATRRLYDGRAGLLAAALTAGTWPWVLYSTNARGYTLIGCAFLLLVLMAADLGEKAHRGKWAWFVLVAGLGLWTVPVLAYLLAGLLLWIAWRRGGVTADLVLAGASIAVLTAVLYLPAVAASGWAVTTIEEMKNAPWHEMPAKWARFAKLVWREWTRDWSMGLKLVAAAGFLAGLRGRKPLWAACAAGALPFLLVHRTVPFTRIWLTMDLVFVMTAAAGLAYMASRIKSRQANVLVAVLAVGAAGTQAVTMVESQTVYRATDTGVYRDAPEAVGWLARHLRPEDGVDATKELMTQFRYEMRRQGLGDRYWVQSAAAERVYVVAEKGRLQEPVVAEFKESVIVLRQSATRASFPLGAREAGSWR